MIFFIIGGKFADIFDKKIFLLGTALFAMASLVAGLSDNLMVLISARLFQGVGFAFTLGLALLMSTQAFPREQQGYILGLSVTVTGVGQAVGPTLGGLILQALSWQWIFMLNVPIALVAFVLIGFVA